MTTKAWMLRRQSTHRIMIERVESAKIIQSIIKSCSKSKATPEVHFTITALVAPVDGLTPQKFTAEDFHNIHETVKLYILSSKLPEKCRCTCLGRRENGGFNRTCLTASHWIVEHGSNSRFRLDADSQPRAGAIRKYDGYRKGGSKKTFIGENGSEDEWILCVEDTKG